jgi:hypothetical protein
MVFELAVPKDMLELATRFPFRYIYGARLLFAVGVKNHHGIVPVGILAVFLLVSGGINQAT